MLKGFKGWVILSVRELFKLIKPLKPFEPAVAAKVSEQPM